MQSKPIADLMRRIVGLVTNTPEDFNGQICAVNFAVFTCRTLDEFKRVACAMNLTLKDRSETWNSPGSPGMLQLRRDLADPLNHDGNQFWIAVEVPLDLVVTAVERPTVEKVYQVPEDLLG